MSWLFWWTFPSCWWKSCNYAFFKQKLKLPFRKTKLGIQNLFYVGPNTWNNLPDNLKSATSVISFEPYIKAYFLKKLGNIEAYIYNYT